jgi:hypothetical protein
MIHLKRESFSEHSPLQIIVDKNTIYRFNQIRHQSADVVASWIRPVGWLSADQQNVTR